MGLQRSLLYSLLLGFDPGFCLGLLSQNVSHTSRVVEFEHAAGLGFHSISRFEGGADTRWCSSARAHESLWSHLVKFNELDAIQDARVGRLVCHFKLDLILLEGSTGLFVHLCQGLQEHQPAKALKSGPLSRLDVYVELFARLVEPWLSNFFFRKTWQLLNCSERCVRHLRMLLYLFWAFIRSLRFLISGY